MSDLAHMDISYLCIFTPIHFGDVYGHNMDLSLGYVTTLIQLYMSCNFKYNENCY
jgi:hypothetical protein